MSIKLHELTAVGVKVQEAIEKGEDWNLALEEIQSEFNDKVLSCGMVYRNIIAESEVYEVESKRLAEKAKTLKNNAEHLREYVQHNMEVLNVKEIKADTFSVKWRKLPDMVQVDFLDNIPQEYIRIIPERREADKDKLIKVLQSGNKVEGVSLLTDRRKVEIK